MDLTSRRAPAPLDLLDRRIVAALQVDGRASWRLVAETLGEPERTVTRRGHRLLAEGLVRVVGKHVRGTSLIARAQAAPGMLRMSTQAWAGRADSTFVYLLSGVAGAVAELYCPPARMASLVVDELPGTPGVTWCATSPVLHYYKTVHEWQPGVLTDDEAGALRTGAGAVPQVPPSNDDTRLSPTDQVLLRALAEDGRQTYDELSRAARVSESTARRRVEALRESGQVYIRAVVAPAVMGLPVHALLWLRTPPAHVAEVGTALAASPYVRYASGLLGEFQLLVEVAVPTLGALQELITTADWAGHVQGLETSLVIETLKSSQVVYA
ncbi:Lrp/AsnC family transcriptional regulator [Pimelobacter simplex]|uniref:Lrp/AsnC family transcriptional regulator n=1 Tax=Nocardioides simplex TaxID=2045 RepID=UPI003AAA6B11